MVGKVSSSQHPIVSDPLCSDSKAKRWWWSQLASPLATSKEICVLSDVPVVPAAVTYAVASFVSIEP